jgi:predicted outer membrane repeat protein
MFRFLALFMLTCTVTGVVSAEASAGRIWYVNHVNSGVQDGLGWSTAFSSLQSALAAVRAGDEIWVAKGTYQPDAKDAMVSFRLKENTSVYGGFAGWETRREERNYSHNLTILSGNIGGGDRSRNTRTIVMGADDAVLDGFTISDAYATDEARMHLVPADILKNDMAVGGGMRNFMVGPIVRNCVFKNNHSPKGGAVYNVRKPGDSQARFFNVDFIGNTAQVRGGAVSNDLGAMPVFVNCRFINNRSGDKGGALYNDFAASPLLINCLFEKNSAVSAGAVGNDGGSSPLLVNVTIRDNSASSGLGAGLYQGTGANNNPVLIKSIVDSIYNWHEDIVAVLASSAPRGETLPLEDFLSVSDLKGRITSADLQSLPSTAMGYQPGLKGETLLANPLIRKLMSFYAQNNASITYKDEYSRPVVSRAASSSPIIYVVPESVSPTRDGGSWSSALTDLQQAIEIASLSKAAVWIKAGTYRPAAREGKIAAFILHDDVKLYGGFEGTETSPEQRKPAVGKTILSAEAASGGYRYPHTLYGADNVLLDGLTIRGGKADGMTYNGKGGGLLAYRAGKTFLPHDEAVGFVMSINNCRFEQNEAIEGGAVYAFGKARLTITHTVFEDNAARYGGAVMDREGNQSVYSHCTFANNRASRDGGAVYVDYGSHAAFSNTAFTANHAVSRGGALYEISRASQLEATVVAIETCTFTGNTAQEGAGIFNLDTSELTLKNTVYPPGSISGAVK